MLDKNLKKLREQKGYSKMKLAKLSGTSRRTIEIIENKDWKNTKLSTVEKLATALNVSTEELIK